MTKAKTPVGTDLEMLQTVQGNRKFEFEYEGFSWVFGYQPITWEQHWEAIEDAWVLTSDGDAEFNTRGYYVTLLIDSKVSLGETILTEEAIRILEPVVFAKLSGIIPSPNLDREVNKIKKE